MGLCLHSNRSKQQIRALLLTCFTLVDTFSSICPSRDKTGVCAQLQRSSLAPLVTRQGNLGSWHFLCVHHKISKEISTIFSEIAVTSGDECQEESVEEKAEKDEKRQQLETCFFWIDISCPRKQKGACQGH